MKKVFAKHCKIKEDINNKRFPVRVTHFTDLVTEMSQTGNLLLLISSLILRCFAKTFSFIVYFYILKEKISGSGRTELSTFVVRVTHFTDLENFLNIFRHLIIIYVY
jgi:hypothetical protein